MLSGAKNLHLIAACDLCALCGEPFPVVRRNSKQMARSKPAGMSYHYRLCVAILTVPSCFGARATK